MLDRFHFSSTCVKTIVFGFIALAWVGIGLVFLPTHASAAVTITSFQVQVQANQNIITWRTASEINNAGFNILRSSSPNGTFAKINPTLIKPAFAMSGADYSYTDTGITAGQPHYYKLQAVETSGRTQEFGPQPSAPPTFATATKTNTPAATATRTNTPGATATRTNTPAATATRTNTPAPLTTVATPTASAPPTKIAVVVVPTQPAQPAAKAPQPPAPSANNSNALPAPTPQPQPILQPDAPATEEPASLDEEIIEDHSAAADNSLILAIKIGVFGLAGLFGLVGLGLSAAVIYKLTGPSRR